MRKLFLMLLFVIGTFFLTSCGSGGDDDVFGPSDFGISQSGYEKNANGTWSGKYGSVNFIILLKDGFVVDYKDQIFSMQSGAGYIGKYSFDQNGNFIARLNSRSPGAPITVVTDEIKGVIKNGKFDGTWTYVDSSASVYPCYMNKIGSDV